VRFNNKTSIQVAKEGLRNFPLALLFTSVVWRFIKRIFKKTTIIGFNISEVTSSEKIRGLLAKLQPFSTGYELIRVGPEGDGGYLIPNVLDGITACYSPGVEEIAGFELELANKGVRCFLADYSVDGPPLEHENIYFEKKYLGSYNDQIYTTLESWIDKTSNSPDDLILQMDIEGAEYEIILNTESDILSRFRIIVIEFHFLDLISNIFAYELVNNTFNKILKNFEVVHIHPNNSEKMVKIRGIEIPPFLEVTFLRNDYVKSRDKIQTLPNSMDRPNKANNADYSIPINWFKCN
jgi:hypothetical protein